MQPSSTAPEKKHLTFDSRFDAYKSFFDHSWTKAILNLVNGTQLDPLVLDLCADWKSAANTFRMPWLMVHSLDSFQAGFVQTQEPFCEKLTRMFRDYVLRNADSSLSNMARKKIISVLQDLGQKAQEEMKRASVPFTVEQLWEEYLHFNEFLLSLWGAQRLCYGAVYYAYENLIQRCIGVAKNDPAYTSKGRNLRDDLNVFVGAGVGDDCLGDDKVVTARLVRHALAHNGGRAGADLLAKADKPAIEGGILQIMPDDVRGLFDLLKGKVDSLVQAALALPHIRTV